MKSLQVIQKRSKSKSELSQLFEILHPITLRHCFIWLPLSQVIELPYNEIEIPIWLYNSKKEELNNQ